MSAQAPVVFLPPLPEWDRTKGYISITKDNFHDISQRAGGDHLKACLLIAERTRSAPHPRPDWAEIEITEFEQILNRSERSVMRVLGDLEKWGWVGRQYPKRQTRRGGFRLLPANFRNRPIPPRRIRKTKPKTAAVLSRMPVAAFTAIDSGPQVVLDSRAPAGFCQSWQNEPGALSSWPIPAVPTVKAPVRHPSELRILPPLAETKLRRQRQDLLPPVAEDSAIRCPIGLACPYTEKDLTPRQTETETVCSMESINSSSKGAAAAAKDEVGIVHAEMRQLGNVARTTSERLLASCRQARAECQAEWIAEVVSSFRGRRGVDNLVGLAIRETPKLIVEFKPPPERSEAADQHRYVLEHPDEFYPDQVEYSRQIVAYERSKRAGGGRGD